MKFAYGGVSADPDAIYRVFGNSNGVMKCFDVFAGVWNEWSRANVIFIDFPYDDRMLKHYYKQIDIETDKTFIDLKNRAFEIIGGVSPERVFVEIGRRNVAQVINGLETLGYSNVVAHDSFYAKTNPCFIVEASKSKLATYQIGGIDELVAIENICKNERGCICDFFNGQGAVSLSAYKSGLDFVCSELNPNRMGKALTRLQKAGATIQ